VGGAWYKRAMEKWIALVVVIAVLRPVLWGSTILLLWAIGRAALPDKTGRVIYGHFWDRRAKDVFVVAATGEAPK
jgi:hypothetical protein